MPFDVEMPDGTIIADVPDGTPKEVIRQMWIASMRVNPTDGMSTADKVLAGTGKAFVDLGTGIQQIGAGVADFVAPREPTMSGLITGQPQTRVDELRRQVADTRALEAPLMDTTAGKVGNLVGNVATVAPTMMIPGANTVTGAGLIGATTGLLQPSASTGETVQNTVLGGVLGAGGQKLGQVAGDKIGQVIGNRATAAAERSAQNSVRDATLAEARRAGYVVPPSTSNPTVGNRVLESMSGKAATQQSAMVRNQQVTNRLVREELGLPKSAPLTTATLDGLRKRAGGVYRAMKNVGEITTDSQYLDDVVNLTRSADEIAGSFGEMNLAGSKEIQALQDSLTQARFGSEAAVELVKRLRADASKNLAWNVEDPSKKALGLAQREAAGIVEEQILRHLQATGKGQLAAEFDSARKLIAKTYSVQSALNEGSGNVVATKLSAQLRKGKPLSGRLETVAKFAEAFPKAAGEQTTSAGVSAVDALLAGGLGATVDPTLFGLPLARIAARGAVLSDPYQAAFATPGYSANNSLLELMKRTAPLSAPVAIGVGNTK